MNDMVMTAPGVNSVRPRADEVVLRTRNLSKQYGTRLAVDQLNLEVHRVRTYSLGMKQRLGVAMALLQDPDVLILDEPANGLDPAGIVEMRDLMHRLSSEGKTIFISSHLLTEVKQICTRAAIIHLGKLVKESTIEELTAGQGEFTVTLERAHEALALLKVQSWGKSARLDGSGTLITSAAAEQMQLHTAKPSFPGILRGEFLKISRQWTTWIMAVLLPGLLVAPFLVLFTVSDTGTFLHQAPLKFFYSRVPANLTLLRVFSGIFLLILTANVIGLEYQLGTIRILLARGVGRVQLLVAKLHAVAAVALVLLVVGLLLNAILTCVGVLAVTGNLAALKALTPTFWSDMQLYLLTIAINMVVTILLAAGVSVLGRSLAFGLSAALVWFPVDNIGTLVFLYAYRLTHDAFWQNVTTYFLGPNLNAMPTLLSPRQPFSIGVVPLAQVDGTHTLLVALVYVLIFVLVAIVLAWKRDVKE